MQTGHLGPQSGYYVSRNPSEGHEMSPPRSPNAVDTAYHWNASLRHRGATTTRETYQGIWHDASDTGHTFYDVSDRHPFVDVAVNTGLRNKQRTVYDAGRNASVWLNPDGTRNSPPSRPTDTHPVTTQAQYRYGLRNGRVAAKTR